MNRLTLSFLVVVLLAGCIRPDQLVDTSGLCGERTWYWDEDDDGYGDESRPREACEQPMFHVGNGLDCNDEVALIFPGAPERCNGVDDDCDGSVDNDLAFFEWYLDEDGDGWGQDVEPVVDCEILQGYAEQVGDCDDSDAEVWPGAPEGPCSGKDLDCDGHFSKALVEDVEYTSLDDAMASVDAAAGLTVWVCPGRHVASYELTTGAHLELRGWSGSHEDTVLVGDGLELKPILDLGAYSSVLLADLGFEGGLSPLGGAVRAVESSLEVDGCLFQDNYARQDGVSDGMGGGIGFASFTGDGGEQNLVVRDTVFLDNEADNGAGAIYAMVGPPGGRVDIEGCSFQRNVAGYVGGSIVLDGWEGNDSESYEVSIRDSSFEDGTAGYSGGAISIQFTATQASVRLEELDFSANTANSNGGAVYLGSYGGQNLEVMSCSFTDNVASSTGGAIESNGSGSCSLQVSDTDFNGNESDGGGAIFANGGSGGLVVDVESSTFTDNYGYGGGGAIGVFESTVFSVDSCTFEGNISSYSGGAVLATSEADGATVTIMDSGFASNQTGWKGGGIFAGPTVSIVTTTFTTNYALWGAGLYFYGSGELSMEDVELIDNEAYSYGGGFTIDNDESPVVTMGGGSLSGNQSNEPGGGARMSLASTLVCDDVDWSSGTSDNLPDDLSGWGETWDDLGAGETFTCGPESCGI